MRGMSVEKIHLFVGNFDKLGRKKGDGVRNE